MLASKKRYLGGDTYHGVTGYDDSYGYDAALADAFYAPAGVFMRNSDPTKEAGTTNYYIVDYANHRVQR